MRSFNEFINENKYGRRNLSPIEKLANKVITSKDYDKIDLHYYKKEFIKNLRSVGFKDDDDISTPLKLSKHPLFKKVDDEYKEIIIPLVGTGKRSPNQKFIKEFANEFKKFPNFLGNDPDEVLGYLVRIKEYLDNNYVGYLGIDSIRLSKMIQSRKLKESLTDEEYKFLQDLVLPKYIKVLERYLTDNLIEKTIKKEAAYYADRNSDELKVLNMNLQRHFSDFFNFIKTKLLNDEMRKADWSSFNVETKYISAEHGPVVSSSFSTTYYYDVEIKISGRTFKYKKVPLGSDYYSGGWN